MRIKHSLKRELYHEKAMDLYFKEGICGTHISDGSILQGRYMRNPYLQDSAISHATKNHGCTHSNILSRKIY